MTSFPLMGEALVEFSVTDIISLNYVRYASSFGISEYPHKSRKLNSFSEFFVQFILILRQFFPGLLLNRDNRTHNAQSQTTFSPPVKLLKSQKRRKVEVHPYDRKAYKGRRDMAPLILNLYTRWQ